MSAHSTDTPLFDLAEVEYRDLSPLNFDGYRVGSDGSVWSARRCRHLGYGRGTESYIALPWKRMTPTPNQNGYLKVTVDNRVVPVHFLVLRMFVGPCPEGQEARHLDGDRRNNRLSNLAWGTPLENHADKQRHGTTARGERHGQAKLSKEAVSIIRADYDPKAGITQQVLADRFGVCQVTVSNVLRGKNW
jgi:hypothetical protein